MVPFLRFALILLVAGLCGGVAALCWIKLHNEPFALYSGFMTLTVLMWLLKLPRPAWMDAAELEKLLEKLNRRQLGQQMAKTSPIGGLKTYSLLEMMFRASAYLEDSYRICSEIADIGREKFVVYVGVGVLALFINTNAEETHEILALRIVSSLLLFGTPFLFSFGIFSKQKQFNEELLTRARVNGIH